MTKGLHVMVEGIDGCGKDTVLNAYMDVAREAGLTIFDVVAYAKKHGSLPDFEKFKDYDVIFNAEPSHAWVGKAIREEIITNHCRHYGAEFTAEMYGSDRLIVYSMIVLPAKAAGKIILQSRGCPTSFCYQPIQDHGYPLEKILEISGNKTALKHPPEILNIVKVEPEEAVRRLNARKTLKDDNAKFEKIEFLKKAQPRYEGTDILPPLFKSSKIAYLDTNGKKVDETVEEAREFAKRYIF